MKTLTTILSAALLALALLACQPQPKIQDFVKYDSEAGVPRVSVEDAKKEFDAGNAVFVDSRGEGAFKAERLPGAVNIPIGSNEEKLNSVPRGKKIFVYCS